MQKQPPKSVLCVPSLLSQSGASKLQKGEPNGFLRCSYFCHDYDLRPGGDVLMIKKLLCFYFFLMGFIVALLVLSVLIVITSNNAHASAVLAQPFQPTSINRMVSSSSLVTASTRFAGVTAANQSVYAVRAVDIGKASVANAVRTRAFTPWGLGLVAAITAAGYILDDGQIKGSTLEGYTEGYYWRSSFYGHAITPDDAAQKHSQGFNSQNNRNSYPTGYTFTSETEIRTTIFDPATNQTFNTTFRLEPCTGVTPACPATAPAGAPVSDDLIFDVFNALPPSAQMDVLTDPLTGFPDAATIPEFQQAADSISSNWNANNDGDPATVPDPEASEQTSEEPFPEEQPEQDICKADPNILACQELGETPDETPIEEMELPIDYQPVSFSSNASCPAPTNMGGGIQYNYDGACQFASGVKPAVITMALISGIYLMGGFRR